MKTFGAIYNNGIKELVSVVLDENGNPIYDSLIPYPKPDDWTMPTIVPLIKIEKPTEGEWNPVLVWFEDRVERQWEPA